MRPASKDYCFIYIYIYNDSSPSAQGIYIYIYIAWADEKEQSFKKYLYGGQQSSIKS